MKAPARRHATLLATLLLAQWGALGLARADAGIGPAPGNTLNPAPVNPFTGGRWMDDDGSRVEDSTSMTRISPSSMCCLWRRAVIPSKRTSLRTLSASPGRYATR